MPYFSRGLRFRAAAAGAQARLQPLQIVAQFRGGWISQRAILFQKLADDPFQLGRDLRIPLANRLGRLIQESVEDNRGRRAVKRPRPRHHFVQNHAERPQVAARIHCLAARLFRRHVGDRAHGRARLREHIHGHRVRIRRLCLVLGQAEVEHLGVTAFGHKNIGRLDIAMNDPFGVRRVQRVGHLDAQRQRGRDIERLAADVLAKCFAVEQLHHQKWMARRLADVVNGANIGMIERRSGARLALETFPRSFRCKGLRQNFDGYVAMEPRVARLIHLAHAAFADGRKNFVRAEKLTRRQRHGVFPILHQSSGG